MKSLHLSFLLLFVPIINGCESCCDEDLPFLSTETLRTHIPYTEGEAIEFLNNSSDTISMKVAADQLDSSGFGSPVYGGCAIYNIEYREVLLKGPNVNLGFSIRLAGDRDSLIDIGNYTSAHLLIDSSGQFFCRAPFNGQFADLICLDSIIISGKTCYHVFRNIDHSSKDTLYYNPQKGILKVCKPGGNRLERLW
ncbi:MAG: hypothetical protein ACKVT2_14740 [Saprospiraceae bacterium]